MHEIDDVLRRRPGLGTLVGEAQALRTQLAKVRGTSVPGASALTAAELFVSPNTAKTHAVSIYRKLDAGSRGQAVARARELGLLES